MAAAARAQAALRGRDRGRRLARARDRVLPREEARHPRRLHPRKVVHRLRRLRPEHDDHPLELPHTRGCGFLRREREALRAALERARLQSHVLAARTSDARALGPRDDHDAGARRGQQAARDQLERRRGGSNSRALPAARPLRSACVSDHGRPLPSARRDHPARRSGVGLCAGCGSARGRDSFLDRGNGLRALGRPHHCGRDLAVAASSVVRS